MHNVRERDASETHKDTVFIIIVLLSARATCYMICFVNIITDIVEHEKSNGKIIDVRHGQLYFIRFYKKRQKYDAVL